MTKIFVAVKCNEKLTKTLNGWELLLVGQAHPLSSNVCFLGHSNRLTDLNKFNFIKDFMWKILILITTQVKKCFHSPFLKRINSSWFCEFSLENTPRMKSYEQVISTFKYFVYYLWPKNHNYFPCWKIYKNPINCVP